MTPEFQRKYYRFIESAFNTKERFVFRGTMEYVAFLNGGRKLHIPETEYRTLCGKIHDKYEYFAHKPAVKVTFKVAPPDKNICRKCARISLGQV